MSNVFDIRPSRVLVVDDMATQRVIIKSVFHPPHYHVTEASRGAQALDLLRREDYDVVLLDVMMPDIDGFEVCRRIRQELNLPFLPVIMITALDSPDSIKRGMEAGASEFVTKPFNRIEIVARLDAAIRSKHLTDKLDDTDVILSSVARMVEARDKETGDHCGRLAYWSDVFGCELNLSADALDVLRRGSVLHDIGKIGVPDGILLKKGPLDEKEWEIMKSHTIIGAQMCRNLKTMKGTVDIIRHHHEKWNGSGYPDALTGSGIPFAARVFQILDVYDALASERPYKKVFSREEIILTLEDEATKGYWDPSLVKVFLNILYTRPNALDYKDDSEDSDFFDKIISSKKA